MSESIYPEADKADRIRTMAAIGGKVITVTYTGTKCVRCKAVLETGTQAVWVRKIGTAHFQGECPK